MKVIAICEYDNDYPIAVVQIPEGLTADQTFIKWIRGQRFGRMSRKNGSNISDQEILELPFLWQELEVKQVS
jgi:hypothetical protein